LTYLLEMLEADDCPTEWNHSSRNTIKVIETDWSGLVCIKSSR
jgi:hypothetical protein